MAIALADSAGPSQIRGEEGWRLLRALEVRFSPGCGSSSYPSITLPPASPLAFPIEVPVRVAAASATMYRLSTWRTGG